MIKVVLRVPQLPDFARYQICYTRYILLALKKQKPLPYQQEAQEEVDKKGESESEVFTCIPSTVYIKAKSH